MEVQKLWWGDHKTQLAAAIRRNMTAHADIRLSCQVDTVLRKTPVSIFNGWRV
jgi:hypothetical protein